MHTDSRSTLAHNTREDTDIGVALDPIQSQARLFPSLEYISRSQPA